MLWDTLIKLFEDTILLGVTVLLIAGIERLIDIIGMTQNPYCSALVNLSSLFCVLIYVMMVISCLYDHWKACWPFQKSSPEMGGSPSELPSRDISTETTLHCQVFPADPTTDTQNMNDSIHRDRQPFDTSGRHSSTKIISQEGNSRIEQEDNSDVRD
jgi:hypothetical protein